MLNRRRLDGCGEEVISNTTKIISGTKPHESLLFLLRATVNTVNFLSGIMSNNVCIVESTVYQAQSTGKIGTMHWYPCDKS